MAIGMVRLLVDGDREFAIKVKRIIKERFDLVGQVCKYDNSGKSAWTVNFESIGRLSLETILKVDGVSRAIL